MYTREEATKYALAELNSGKITLDEANVLIYKMVGVNVITKLPREIRKALNLAVKKGELGHLKKDGLKPEIYYNLNVKEEAIKKQYEHLKMYAKVLKKVLC